jgi:hypothetical protein
MQRFALAAGVLAVGLGGCLSNPTVEVDKQSLELPRGASTDLLVSIDGTPVWSLDEVLWTVDDEHLVTVSKSYDGYHLRVGGNFEGDTVVHVNSHGQDVAIPTHVGPPAVLMIWTEPTSVNTVIGSQVQVKAKTLDTLARVEDVTFASRWDVRDDSIANLDQAGMMLRAMDIGETTLHVSHGASSAVVPVAIYK